MFKLNAIFDADSLLYSLSLNAMATQYPCSLNSIYCLHLLLRKIGGLSEKSPSIYNIMRMVCDIDVTWQPRKVDWNAHM